MSDGDDKLLRRYRELAREEPPPAVDSAILAASRRAVASRPWSQRFAGPVSIAAVLVLAVGVTLNMQRDQPGVEMAMPAGEAPVQSRPAAPAAPSAPAAAADAFKPDAPVPQKVAPAARVAKPRAPAELKKEAVAPEVPMEPKRTEPQALSVPAPAAPPMQERAATAARSLAREAPLADARDKRAFQDAAALSAKSTATLTDPAAELERIARLRSEGKDEEADKALEAFTRVHVDYRIPDAVLERVKRR